MTGRLDETRLAYDTVAETYAELLVTELDEKPLDRALLNAFAESVDGQILDAGCGPGRVAAYLAAQGAEVWGIDLSPGMIEVAHTSYPDLRFEVGSIEALNVPDASLGGIVAWYSIIHTPPELLSGVFTEFARVLAPGGRVLLAFQAGEDEPRHIAQGYGHEVALDAWRLSPNGVAERLAQAGIVIDTRVLRDPHPPEKVPQAYLMGRKS